MIENFCLVFFRLLHSQQKGSEYSELEVIIQQNNQIFHLYNFCLANVTVSKYDMDKERSGLLDPTV